MSKDDAENGDDVRSDNEAEDPDVCGDVSDSNPDVEETKDDKNKDKAIIALPNECENETVNMTIKDNSETKVLKNDVDGEPQSSEEIQLIHSPKPESLEIDEEHEEGVKDMSTNKHFIKEMVNPEINNEIDIPIPKAHTGRSNSILGEMTSHMTPSSSPSPPLTSMALVNNARASMMMTSKPMLQQSFTQTLMALSNNAMNRPSFFPMLDR